MSFGNTVRQEPRPAPPQFNETDLYYMNGGDTRPINREMLNRGDLDLEFEQQARVPLQTPAPRQGPFFGIPGRDTQTGSLELEQLRLEMRVLHSTLHELSAENRDWLLSCFREFRSRVATPKTNPETNRMKNSGNRISKTPANKPNVKAGKVNVKTGKFKKKPFRCFKCGTEFGTVGALQRHIEDKHYPCVSISCPELGCVEVSRRRDKARDHCLLKHEWKPSNEQLALYTQHLACPPVCCFCPRTVGDWKEFYKCFISHCDIDNGNHDEGSSDDDDQDNGEGPAPGNDSTFPGFGMGGAGTSFNNGYNDCTGFSTQDLNSFYTMQSYNQNVNQYAHGMQRSSSDTNNMIQSQSDFYHDANRKRRVSVQDHSDLSWKAQQPGPQQRPMKQHKQARVEPQVDQFCPKCSHEISGCKRCDKKPISGEPCHVCDDAPGTQASAPSSQVFRHTGLIQGSMNPQVNPVPNQTQLSHLYRLQVPRPFGNANHQVPWHPAHYGYPAGNSQGRPRGPDNNFTTNVAILSYVHDFSETEMLSTESKNASLGETWLSCLAMRTPTGRMIRVPQKATALGYGVGSGAIGTTTFTDHRVFRPIYPVMLTLTDQVIPQTISETELPQINLPMAKLEAISPLLCRCPCRTKTAGPTYTSNARIELVPGKLLDMALTISPEDRVGHPLRTRVRVVVKLLKLRSSVARSGNKKKNKQDAKEIEQVLKTSLYGSALSRPVKTNDETVAIDESDMSESEYDGLFSDYSDTESVTSSVAEASSVSELALVPFERIKSNILFPDDDSEEIPHSNEPNADDLSDEMESLSLDDTNDFDIQETEFEIALDLDLHTCLDNLSNWTDGLADIERSGHITDPARVFELFFKYIIYVIFALSRSRIEAAGR